MRLIVAYYLLRLQMIIGSGGLISFTLGLAAIDLMQSTSPAVLNKSNVYGLPAHRHEREYPPRLARHVARGSTHLTWAAGPRCLRCLSGIRIGREPRMSAWRQSMPVLCL